MNWVKKAIGVVLVALPFVVILLLMTPEARAIVIGVIVALVIVLGCLFAIAASIIIGLFLLMDE